MQRPGSGLGGSDKVVDPQNAGDTLTADTSAAAPPPRARPPGLAGDDGARYELVREIARGGGGRIELVIDHKLRRRIAVKRPLTRRGAARLEREALITARLEHPAIVPVHDAGRDATGQPFYAMKLLGGATLRDRIRATPALEGRLGLLRVASAVCDAIAYAHAQRVIHRDLKPANVIVGEFGEVAVIDWGLAKTLGDAEPPGRDAALGAEVTAHGAVIGTPAYMAPEQARGEALDERADVYALGALLYEILSGQTPYSRLETPEVLVRLKAGPPPALRDREPRVPADLAAIVGKAMARSPGDRYASAGELADDLHRYEAGRLVTARRYAPWTRLRRWLRRRRYAVIATATAFALAGAGWLAGAVRTPAATCSGARERLTGVWDAARRARAEARFATSELGAAWPAVAGQLDDYGDAWVAMQNAACRATRVDGVQPEQVLALRTACLERRRADLAALAGQLERADDGVIARARAAVAALAPIDDCHDQPELLAHAVALHGNAIDGAWQDRLSQIKALFDVGRWREGLAAAAALTRDADAGANPAVRGAAWAWLGQLQFELIDPAAAERSLETALRLTAEAGDDVAAAHVVAGLVLALGQIDGRRAEGLTVAEVGRAHVARAGGDDLLRAELLNARSEVLEEVRRSDDARAALTEALALWSAHLPPDDLRIARSTSLLARNRRRAGAYAEADALYQQALAIYERRIGPDHPTTAQALDHFALVALDLHHFDESIARSTRALAIKRRVFGAESSEYADTQSNLGNARFLRGDVDGAVAAWQGSLAIYEARYPDAHDSIARALGNLGVARRRQGRLDDATALHRRVLAIRTANASPSI
ncbi:MAG TPA: serine/threonine-protein kinase, partial [Kofleriaceae bacterium]|nr:serine/threonine-protein kinase [Kofleriaceae bacterium]